MISEARVGEAGDDFGGRDGNEAKGSEGVRPRLFT